jgi:hypothetical protein
MSTTVFVDLRAGADDPLLTSASAWIPIFPSMARGWVAVAALSFFLWPLHSFSQTGPIRIPKDGDGYRVTRSDTRSDPAPEGYAGRTDTETLTAVGNTPATMGKTIVARFTLGNKIKICPAADGASEGTGVFTLSLDYTDQQPTGTSRLRIEMRADGKYKGEVGDDAWLVNPVKADIDYTYTVSGSMRDASGAIATPAGSNVAQQITIPFTVGRGLSAPGVGAFSGGDPTGGRYAQAVGAGTALVYWAGVYYAEAQAKWRDRGRCVSAAVDPPSNTTRLVPGGRTDVKVEIKTKSGETVKARFFDARTLGSAGGVSVSGASVSPVEGSSDAGAPMTFTFTAPAAKADRTGFVVDVTSRAGVTDGEWLAGLGTDWSGRITLLTTNRGDAGANELQTWSNSSFTQITADIKNGTGWAYGHTEVHYLGVRRQKALRGGTVTVVFDSSDVTDGTLSDAVMSQVEVVYPNSGTYSIRLRALFTKEGKSQTQSCNRNTGCRNSEQQLLMGATWGAMTGKVEDPNHLRGSRTETRTGVGYQGTGTITTTVTWDLARQGTGK